MKLQKRFFLLCFSLLLFSFCLLGPESRALETNPVVCVGLYYGSNALPAANLQNVSGMGSGYRLGYFDWPSGRFTSLMEIDTVEITIVKDKLLYISADKTYTDVAPANYSSTVGPYHLQTSRRFSSWQEALAFCQSLSMEAFPAYVDGAYVARIGQYGSSAQAQSAQAAVAAAAGEVSVCGYSQSCYTVTATGSHDILFELDSGGHCLGVQPRGEHTQTWFKGYKYYGGFEYNRVNGNDVTVINVVEMDDYLKGVVPYEMSASWPTEALKAQALCAKSYCVQNKNKHKTQGFDLCNSTDCQVYRGTNSATANSDGAVEAVSGQYVTYNGQIAQTFYHASSGGATEDVENIWDDYVPYLRGVEDTYLTNKISWSAQLTNESVAAILRGKGYSVSSVTDLYVSGLTRSGNVRELTVVQSSGSPLVFSGEKARTILNSSAYGVSFLSQRYTVSGNGGSPSDGSSAGVGAAYVNDQKISLSGLQAIGKSGLSPVASGNLFAVTGKGVAALNVSSSASSVNTAGSGVYAVSGSGSGHHVGLSQWGANGMAKAGFDYQQIVKFYFTGVQVGPAA